MMDNQTTLTQTPEAEIGSVFVSNYPPYSVWNPDHLKHARAALQSPAGPDRSLGLYLHVPFCRKRCKFCYFKVYTDIDSARIRRYLRALEREVALLAACPAVAGRALQFVYFGGGTPSFISARDLMALVASVRASLPWDGAKEITFECEPGTLTQPKLEAIRRIGVTRLSLGVESYDDGILKENGRAHLSAEIDRVMPWIRSMSFDQLNIDLIAGMLGETDATWSHSVQRTIEASPDSVTIYQMELPYNTTYADALSHHTLPVPLSTWDQRRAWNDRAIEAFLAAGYEISSAYTMVKKGSAAGFVYRDAVWHGSDMLGTGVASFSHLGGVHYQNESEMGPWQDRLEAGELPLARALRTTPEERCVREMILRLKLGHLDARAFQAKFGVDILARHAGAFAQLQSEGMLRVESGRVVLTRAGLLRVDHLLPRFYADEYRGARYT
ncbi:MAG: coproporphyrinogen-III oxidase family protein [Candidatus Polarisedimenticolia bacterium]